MSNTSPTPLITLTDRDLLLNLWVSLLVMVEGFEMDPDSCTQSIFRDRRDPDPQCPGITLTQLLAEVETRLGISGGLDGFQQERQH